ncbi:family 43 glycosylhydrolase [Paenibacillus silvae]|uniref:glycoside hydrolase family 43 protein n=1 Tax=Paenibacillus silvae TaxID=1325358 RepID=UPI0025A2440A|nr:family 43 glycosylhydrolase [Paenibacillus silvae]MDM5279461.1 family 43 glycosylhydrolase [Paenibacillus silvae]
MTKTMTFTNPVLEQRADPWVYRHTDGYYYFSASVPAFDRIEIRRAETLEALREAEPVTAWTKRETGLMSANIWAPEIHFIDGKWYIYFAAAHTSETNDGLFDHRMYVLENASANPLEGKWMEKGQIQTRWESFALDATTFEHKGTRYLVWAQKDPSIDGNSNLYISEMENPWTLRGEQVMISTPEYDWEIIGFKVNEGAAVLHRNGRLFISYSASATDHHYCMGLLTADEDANLLDPASWVKSPEPVFQTCEENGQYGPGHNSFTVSPDGKTDILIYHARNYKEIEGDPLYDPNRHARAQVIHWNEDGTPSFGVPVPDGRAVTELK